MVEQLEELAKRVKPADKKAQRHFLINQYKLAKPVGSLGKIDDIVYRLSGINEYFEKEGDLTKTIFVLAGDHGVSSEGVSLYKPSVTMKVLTLINNGKAPINVIANQNAANLVLADLGVIGDTDHLQNVRKLKVRRGTSNFAHMPAMTRDEAVTAICRGASLIDSLDHGKRNLIAVGEIGIGNTTASSIITSYICNVSIEETIGYGTGISEEGLDKKIWLAKNSIAVNKLEKDCHPLDLLRIFGGFEIAGVVGLILAAASKRVPILLDGFITSAAASIAVLLNENVRDYLFASHQSTETGHKYLLHFLKLDPLLELNMKLGMASGAGIAMSLVELGCKISTHTGLISELDLTQREKNY
ncbi:nicotinate-nucleotide--dimethylbenzimidazole phosphoribosyltransferase [Paenibacillus xylanexedens]|uniref:nicotinate-nucleotide--dimethylbenzimidazole phosphoribosyltransferase n=1 Tax=Paenibacillus xylanexedens TaxID=528191 RepID=UPI003D029160